jgi:rhodanese-related sulfurtransferase
MNTLSVAMLLAAILNTNTRPAIGLDEGALPKSKRTSLGLYITAEEAYERWKADPVNVRVIDVRTPEEHRLIGFPKMAARIPLSAPTQFVGRVKLVAEPKDTILVICRSGNRSAVAAEMLARAGFKNAYTVADGFEGDRDSDPSSPDYGKRTVNGWKNAGLPWTRVKERRHRTHRADSS